MKEIYGPEASIFRDYVPDIAAFLEEEKVPGESVICVGKISHPGRSSYEKEVKYLQSITPKDRHGDLKLTLAAPNWYHLRYKEGKAYPKDVYRTDEVGPQSCHNELRSLSNCRNISPTLRRRTRTSSRFCTTSGFGMFKSMIRTWPVSLERRLR